MTSKNQPLLELKNVSRTFLQAGEKVHALHGASAEFFAGELSAIIGPSGSGKSTFLTIAGGLQSPTSGKVIVKGQDVFRLPKSKLSDFRLHEIGFILQTSNLVPYLNVKDQLVLLDKVLRRKNRDGEIEKILESLGVARLANKYPDELSGGERQRIAIAKVLYSSSSVILADEPTASLDTKRALDVVVLLAKETRSRQKATVMVTHDERLTAYCDSVYEMHDGVLTKRKNHRKTK